MKRTSERRNDKADKRSSIKEEINRKEEGMKRREK
jgi:hypothetical protein